MIIFKHKLTNWLIKTKIKNLKINKYNHKLNLPNKMLINKIRAKMIILKYKLTNWLIRSKI